MIMVMMLMMMMVVIRFHAYFPAGNSYPSILADMLSDAIGCVGFSWVSSSSTSLSVTYSIFTFVKTWLLIIIRQKTSLVLSFKWLIVIITAIVIIIFVIVIFIIITIIIVILLFIRQQAPLVLSLKQLFSIGLEPWLVSIWWPMTNGTMIGQYNIHD